MAKRNSIRAVAFSTAFIVSAMSFPMTASAQDCTPADIALVSQAEIDNFQSNHGPCDHVTGELRIEGENISSLSGLSELKQVHSLYLTNNPVLTDLQEFAALNSVSRLHISRHPSLTDLQGLAALASVGSIYIAYNGSLPTMAGLEAVKQVGDLTIRGNSSLRNMEGLSGLTRVGGNRLEISNNSALESLDGLESLHTVLGELTIEDNNALKNIDGLSSLTTVTIDVVFSIRIQRNAALANLDGLSSLSDVPGGLIIHLNDSLSDLSGLSNLTHVGTWLHIAANPALTDLDGLQGLKTVGALGIINNASLADLSGLSNLETVQTIFEISWNPMLTHLNGLSSLTHVGSTGSTMKGLLIEYNATLNNLDGLSAVQAVGNLVIEDNPLLANCQGLVTLIDPIDDFDPGPGPGVSNIPDIFGEARIQRNMGNCNSTNGILGEVPLLSINAGLNDAWFNLDTNGQGFLIIIFPEIQQMFVAWFTYDTERPPEDVTALLGEPGHRWLTAQGAYEENIAQLEVFVTSGGIFDSPFPETVTEPDGEITLEFSTCNAGTLTYDIASIDRQGVVPIERITLDNVPLCYLLNAGSVNAAISR
jgi:hypothetical protein